MARGGRRLGWPLFSPGLPVRPRPVSPAGGRSAQLADAADLGVVDAAEQALRPEVLATLRAQLAADDSTVTGPGAAGTG